MARKTIKVKHQKSVAKKIIITGISGFVGKHLVDYLLSQKKSVEIIGIDMVPPSFTIPQNCIFKKINLLDESGVNKLIENLKPDFVIHLASFSKVSESWINPIESFKNNTNIFLNLVDALRKNSNKTKLLSIGSSEEYGIVDKKSVPLKETHVLNPNSPYAVARISQEMMSKIYARGYGMNIVLTRSFNHYGLFQNENFVIPSIVNQLCKIKKDKKKSTLLVGNIEVIRDFVHVSDVVKAYAFLLEKGVKGEVYNICTGRGISLREVIRLISKKLGIDPVIKIDKKLYRPNDNPIIIGDNTKIKSLGWKPEISLEEGLDELINFYLSKIK